MTRRHSTVRRGALSNRGRSQCQCYAPSNVKVVDLRETPKDLWGSWSSALREEDTNEIDSIRLSSQYMMNYEGTTNRAAFYRSRYVTRWSVETLVYNRATFSQFILCDDGRTSVMIAALVHRIRPLYF
uniref:Uncharacterized protein n=1 Tax=Peronospora matthiolae TaxID=2874970 RepID=A0AAV1TV09_9STRA